MSWSKYRAKRTELNGRVFASKREAQVAREYQMLMRSGDILGIEYQPVFELTPKPNRIKYVADFRIMWKSGKTEIVDVKGFETPVFKLKKKLFAHFHPDKKLVVRK